jgi:hypothetical protein
VGAPPNFREIHGGWGDVRVPISKVIKIKIIMIKNLNNNNSTHANSSSCNLVETL